MPRGWSAGASCQPTTSALDLSPKGRNSTMKISTLRTALLPLLSALAIASTATAQRSVQIRSIDFETRIIEVTNFDTVDIDLTGWRFCSHDFNQSLRYTSAPSLNGVTLEAGTSIFVHFMNDAPMGDPDRFNRLDLGNFALPLTPDAYGIQFYFPNAMGTISFANSSLIADHMQWNRSGATVGSAATRSNQAVGQGLWTATSDFIPTEADTRRIVLTDGSGDEAGGPGEYISLAMGDFDESVDGDLSDDPAAPDTIVLGLGSTQVLTSQQGDAFGRDIDYFTFDVPAGQQLDSLSLVSYFADDIGNQAFLGLQAGSVFTVDAGSAMASDLLGGAVYGAGLVGSDLLSGIGSLPGAMGFTPPLSSGSYTIWLNQTGPNSMAGFEFTLAPSDSIGTSFCMANANSSGTPALIRAEGSNVVADNDFTLITEGLPAGVSALHFLGPNQVQVPFGDGFRCVGGQTTRVQPVQSANALGVTTRTIDLTAAPAAGLIVPSADLNFQLWYRDGPAGMSGFNLSDGVNVVFQ